MNEFAYPEKAKNKQSQARFPRTVLENMGAMAENVDIRWEF